MSDFALDPLADGLGSVHKVEMVPASRPLTAGEISMCEKVYGSTIPYGDVKIFNANYLAWQGGNYAMTPDGNIYLGSKLRDHPDFSLPEADPYVRLFIHEMGHVWQHYHGVNVLSAGVGLQTKQFLCVWCDSVYDYKIDVNKKLKNYNIEQQATIFSDYFLILQGRPFKDSKEDYEKVLGNFPNSY